jgi:hypothetical protein
VLSPALRTVVDELLRRTSSGLDATSFAEATATGRGWQVTEALERTLSDLADTPSAS